MKKTVTLLAATLLSIASFGQVFSSDMSSWNAGSMTDWSGTKTNIDTLVEVGIGATYGTSMAQLINAESGHERLATMPVSIVKDSAYDVTIWLGGMGEIRTGLYDGMANSSGGYSYNGYEVINTLTSTMITQQFIADTTTSAAEFILSVRNTMAPGHLVVDSVVIALGTPNPVILVPIYDIQYTTASPANSAYDGQVVTTSGIVTATLGSGYFIQDGTTGWNGLYVYDNTNSVNLGDEIEVTGTVDEYFDYTELTFVSNVDVISTGNTLPTPINLSTSAMNDEQYEGMLLVIDGNCNNNNLGNGEWSINDGSGVARINDLMYNYSATVSSNYTVTGVLFYSFNNFKLEPRDANDVMVGLSISDPEYFNLNIYPNPANLGFVSITFNEKVQGEMNIFTLEGKVVKTAFIHSDEQIDISDLANGTYLVRFNVENKELTQKLVIK